MQTVPILMVRSNAIAKLVFWRMEKHAQVCFYNNFKDLNRKEKERFICRYNIEAERFL
jgi:hypothetical protein